MPNDSAQFLLGASIVLENTMQEELLKLENEFARAPECRRSRLRFGSFILVVAHGTLWRQFLNYETPLRVVTIANSFRYFPADNNIAVRVAADYPPG